MERRAHPRQSTSLTARMATAGERVAPAVEVINLSDGGVLIAYQEPVGVLADERVVISMTREHGRAVHLLATVARVAHGTDFRTYVAVQFEAGQDEEIAGLRGVERSRSDV